MDLGSGGMLPLLITNMSIILRINCHETRISVCVYSGIKISTYPGCSVSRTTIVLDLTIVSGIYHDDKAELKSFVQLAGLPSNTAVS